MEMKKVNERCWQEENKWVRRDGDEDVTRQGEKIRKERQEGRNPVDVKKETAIRKVRNPKTFNFQWTVALSGNGTYIIHAIHIMHPIHTITPYTPYTTPISIAKYINIWLSNLNVTLHYDNTTSHNVYIYWTAHRLIAIGLDAAYMEMSGWAQ